MHEDWNEFNEVIMKRDEDDVRRLFSEEYINMKDWARRTSLHYACGPGCGDLNIVKYLLDKGFDIEAENKDKVRPIHVATLFGQKSLVEELINRGCVLTSVNEGGETAMEMAARKGYQEIENILYEAMKTSCGKSINEYTKETLLGKGAYCLVYKGLHKETNKYFAIKEVKNDVNAKIMQSLENKIHIYKRLPLNQFIVKYYGTIKDEETTNIIMEYVNGESLRSKLDKQGTLHLSDIALYSIQILEALKFLHGHRIIHRDIKSSNIMINKEDCVKLCDFSTDRYLRSMEGTVENLTKYLRDKTTSSSESLFYVAPEVIERSEYTFAADIWSFGATVYEMFTGHPPFYDLEPNDPKVEIKSKNEIELKSSISFPKDLGSFMDSIFVADPRKRADIETLLKSELLTTSCGKSINEYKKETKLGTGAYGSVYKYLKNGTNKYFAIKVLDKYDSEKKTLENEIHIYKRLPLNRYIIRYYGTIKDKLNTNIILEYVNGESLKSKINDRTTLNITEIVYYSIQILEGLKFLHGHGIIHRDIKSSNIMINKEDCVKLCDFGTSRYLKQLNDMNASSRETATTSIGSEFYRAPEVVTGPKYTFSADIWSFGATVLEICTGRPPFYKEGTIVANILIGMKRKIEYRSETPIPGDLRSFMDSIFVADPTKRADIETLLKSELLNKNAQPLLENCRKDTELSDGVYESVIKYLDEQINKYCVMRECDISDNANKAAVESLQINVTKYKQLSRHPNLVPYYDIISDSSCIRIGTEYMNAGSLRQKLDTETKLSLIDIARYTKQILEGLGYLHANCLIHGNIKAANVMFDSEGIAMLCDYGIHTDLYRIMKARASESELEEFITEVARKHSYWMAPEINIGDEPTMSSDVWSLGATVVEMLTGKPLYHGFDPLNVARTIRSTKKFNYEFKPWIPNNLEFFMDAMLDHDPDKRANAKTLLESNFLAEYCPQDKEASFSSAPLKTSLTYHDIDAF